MESELPQADRQSTVGDPENKTEFESDKAVLVGDKGSDNCELWNMRATRTQHPNCWRDNFCFPADTPGFGEPGDTFITPRHTLALRN